MKSRKKKPRAAAKTLTAAEARALLKYNPRSGTMTWRNSRSGPAQQGAAAGFKTPGGRVRVSLLRKSYARSRLAWLMQTGEWPAPGLVVDHIDGDCSNDAWRNLRLATPAANAANRRAPKSKSGVVGVSYCNERVRKPWRARIVYRGRVIPLGLYERKADAIAARRAAEEQLQGEFALRNRPRSRRRNLPSLLSLSDLHPSLF